LKPGGALLLRTPNLRFIVERYLSGEITPEWPGDERAMVNVFGVCGPSQWANIKLFSGQDYPSNFHYNCFDRQSMEQYLKHHGFSQVVDHHWPREISPGELQIKAVK
jgi:predicted SAM-dependent methyltransferase